MSCFVVSHKHINYILNGISFMQHARYWEPCQMSEKRLTVLGRNMLKNNHLAYHQRYGDPITAEDWQDIKSFKYKPIKSFDTDNLPQAIQACRSLTYQCSEGKIAENFMTKKIDNLANEMAYTYMDQAGCFKDLAWSL